ncbi:MAG: hypothetical protein QW273_01170 [Candidatus Pacearchaeota archaeon]
MKKIIKKEKKSNLRLFYLALFILIILLIFLLSIKFISKYKTDNKISEVEAFDECIVVLGNLIHEIEDEDSCKLACQTECSFLNKKYFEHEFFSYKDKCNKCLCRCKGEYGRNR